MRWSRILSLSKGGNSLFAAIRFADDAAKQLGLRHDVSVHIPPSVVDGRGIEYINPIEHIAATAFPVIPGLGPWVIDETDPLGLTYHKEVLPEGEWFKQSDNLQFEITASYLDDAPSTFDKMQANGVAVPYQMLHNKDGTKLGDVLQLYKAPKSKQLPNKPAGALSIKAKEHVLRLAQEKGNAMNWLDWILQKLGLQAPPNASDADKQALIEQAAQQQGAPAATASQNNPQQQQPQQVTYQLTPVAQPVNANPSLVQQSQQPAQVAAASQGVGFTPVMVQPGVNPQIGAASAPAMQQGAAPITPNTAPALPGLQLPPMPTASQVTVKLSQKVSEMVRNAKKTQLDGAVASGIITPAEASILEHMHLTDDKLALSCSDSGPDPISDYLKAKQVATPAWQSIGRTPADTQQVGVALSHAQNQGQTSPLMANRLKRIEAAK